MPGYRGDQPSMGLLRRDGVIDTELLLALVDQPLRVLAARYTQQLFRAGVDPSDRIAVDVDGVRRSPTARPFSTGTVNTTRTAYGSLRIGASRRSCWPRRLRVGALAALRVRPWHPPKQVAGQPCCGPNLRRHALLRLYQRKGCFPPYGCGAPCTGAQPALLRRWISHGIPPESQAASDEIRDPQ